MFLTLTALVGALACGTEGGSPTGVTPSDDTAAEARRVARVTATPDAVSMDSGSTRQLAASAVDGNGRVVNNASITWTAIDGNVATVSASGLVTAVRSGVARVRAQASGFADTTTVTVPAAAPSPAPAPTPTPTPSPTPTPTPTPAPAPAPAPAPSPVPPDVIFHDDFESGTLNAWQDGVNTTKHRVINDATKAASGSRYLEITYPGGAEGGWLTRFFMPGYDSIYVRYDVQFESSWVGGTKLLNVRGSRTDNQWSSFGKAGQCPNGNEWFATNVVMLANENPGPIRFYTYFPGMQPENDGVTCWGRHSGMGVTNYTGTSTISRGVWHRVEFWVKLNTPGQNDGVQRLWVDGQLRGEWTGLALRNTNLLRLNSITLEASLMGGTQPTTRRLMVDNVVVARTRSTN